MARDEQGEAAAAPGSRSEAVLDRDDEDDGPRPSEGALAGAEETE
jgi:hypothetical protein